jgi:hypothetical protein
MIVCFQMVPFLQPAHNLPLFRAIQPPADPTTPTLFKATERKSWGADFPPSLQQFLGDVICGLNLSEPTERRNHYSGVLCI